MCHHKETFKSFTVAHWDLLMKGKDGICFQRLVHYFFEALHSGKLRRPRLAQANEREKREWSNSLWDKKRGRTNSCRLDDDDDADIRDEQCRPKWKIELTFLDYFLIESSFYFALFDPTFEGHSSSPFFCLNSNESAFELALRPLSRLITLFKR